MTEGQKTPKKADYRLILLIVVLLTALYLRVQDIGAQSLWLDEGFSVGNAENLSRSFSSVENFKQYYADYNPPLYPFLLHIFIRLLGTSEQAVRLPSAIFGVLSVYMIYLFGKSLHNKNTGIIAAVLMAINAFHIYYSQEARPYSLIVLIALASFYFLEKSIKEGGGKNIAAYVMSSILLLYTHNLTVLLIFTQNVYVFSLLLLFSRKKQQKYGINLKNWILCQLILLIAFAPWLVVMKFYFSEVSRGYWTSKPNQFDLVTTFFSFSGSPVLSQLYLLLIPLAFACREMVKGRIEWKSLFSSLEDSKWKMRFENVGMFYGTLLWLALPIAVTYVFSVFFTPIYVHRYLIASFPPFILLVAAGLEKMDFKYFKVIVIIIILAVSFHSLGRTSYFSISHKKHNWRGAVRTVESMARPGQTVVVTAGYTKEYIYDYYAKRKNLNVVPFPASSSTIRAAGDYVRLKPKDRKELEKIVKDRNYVWFVIAHCQDPEKIIETTMTKNHHVRYYKAFHYVTIILYKKDDVRK